MRFPSRKGKSHSTRRIHRAWIVSLARITNGVSHLSGSNKRAVFERTTRLVTAPSPHRRTRMPKAFRQVCHWKPKVKWGVEHLHDQVDK